MAPRAAASVYMVLPYIEVAIDWWHEDALQTRAVAASQRLPHSCDRWAVWGVLQAARSNSAANRAKISIERKTIVVLLLIFALKG